MFPNLFSQCIFINAVFNGGQEKEFTICVRDGLEGSPFVVIRTYVEETNRLLDTDLVYNILPSNQNTTLNPEDN